VSAFQYDLDFLLKDRWYVPVKDLVEIYRYAPQYVNKTVNASAIEECQALFFTASWAIKNFGSDLFSDMVAPAPFLPAQFQDFFVGGIDDNSAWTNFVWPRMLAWARSGPPPGPLPPIYAAPSRPARRLPPALSRLVQALKPLLRSGVLDSMLEMRRTPRGVSVGLREGTAHSPAAKVIRDLLVHSTLPHAALSIKLLSAATQRAPNLRASVMVQGDYANEYFGAAICSGDFDGDNILVYIHCNLFV
jgi:hypothetical protein